MFNTQIAQQNFWFKLLASMYQPVLSALVGSNLDHIPVHRLSKKKLKYLETVVADKIPWPRLIYIYNLSQSWAIF